MLGLLKKWFSGAEGQRAEQKKRLESGDPVARRELAVGETTLPEILYFLARDEDEEIRRLATLNKAMPVQASAILVNDSSVDVRLALAARLVDLLPDLSVDKHSQLYAYAVQALGALAQDEVLKIRQALSSALKDHAKAPPKVVGKLARDVERAVSEPILRFCIALSDDDLLDILSNHPEPWVISSIAARPVVSERVAGAVVESKDVPAGTELIRNKGARLGIEALQKIIAQAAEHPEWHEPLAARKDLSFDFVQKLAGFVSESVLATLEQRSDFDPATRKEVAELVKRRMEFHRQGTPHEPAEAKVERYAKTGKLNANVIQDALAWDDHKFVLLALARVSNIHTIIVEKMLRSGSPKSIIALCWKAKMPMRLAVELQRNYARLHPNDFMYPKGGTDYPMDLPEIKWQLDFYGVDVTK